MSNRTPTQDKAIAWYCENNNFIPQLSTHPMYYFKDKDSGEVTKRHLEHITNEYVTFTKENKKKGRDK